MPGAVQASSRFFIIFNEQLAVNVSNNLVNLQCEEIYKDKYKD